MMLFNQPGEKNNKRDDKKDDRLREEEQEIAMKLAPSYALLSNWNGASVDINSVSALKKKKKSQLETPLVS